MTEAQETRQEAQTGLTIQDLALVVQIIQAASSRGAIKAEELAVVGELYNRLVTFLNSLNPPPAESATSEEVGDQPNTAPESN